MASTADPPAGDPLAALLSPRPGAALRLLVDRDPTQLRCALTIDELTDRSAAAAARLLERGAAAGDRVAIALPTSMEFVAALLGAMWIGAVPVPLPSLGQTHRRAAIDRLAGALTACAARLLVCDAPTQRRLDGAGGGAGVTRIAPEELAGAGAPPRAPTATTATAFLQFTSGSSGAPKGVVVSHANLEANLLGIARAVRLGDGDRVLSWLPLYHDMGLVGTLLFALRHRVPLDLFSPLGFLGRPSNWPRAIAAHRATLSPAPHFAYAMLAHQLPAAQLAAIGDLSSWRLALDGSEPIRPATARAFMRRFAALGLPATAYLPVYGLAEATLAAALPSPAEGARFERLRRSALSANFAEPAADDDPDAHEVISVGRALAGHLVEVRAAASDLPLPDRHLGEICLSGPSIAAGYFGAPPRPGPLRTGDLGFLVDGRLHVVDRLKEIIIHGGAKYYPSEVEPAVERVAGVRGGRAIAVSAARGTTAPEALVVIAELEPGARSIEVSAAIRRAVLEAVGIAPADVVLVAPRSLPLAPGGKPMRGRCRELYTDGALLSVP